MRGYESGTASGVLNTSACTLRQFDCCCSASSKTVCWSLLSAVKPRAHRVLLKYVTGGCSGLCRGCLSGATAAGPNLHRTELELRFDKHHVNSAAKCWSDSYATAHHDSVDDRLPCSGSALERAALSLAASASRSLKGAAQASDANTPLCPLGLCCCPPDVLAAHWDTEIGAEAEQKR